MDLIRPLFPFYMRMKNKLPRKLLFTFFYLGELLGKIYIIHEERAIEHPWILKELKYIKRGSCVLDIGCVDSLISNVLISMGFKTFGIDIRPYNEAHPWMKFLQRDLMNSGLTDQFFDCVIANNV